MRKTFGMLMVFAVLLVFAGAAQATELTTPSFLALRTNDVLSCRAVNATASWQTVRITFWNEAGFMLADSGSQRLSPGQDHAEFIRIPGAGGATPARAYCKFAVSTSSGIRAVGEIYNPDTGERSSMGKAE